MGNLARRSGTAAPEGDRKTSCLSALGLRIISEIIREVWARDHAEPESCRSSGCDGLRA